MAGMFGGQPCDASKVENCPGANSEKVKNTGEMKTPIKAKTRNTGKANTVRVIYIFHFLHM